MIDKLSMFSGQGPIKTKDPDGVILHPIVEDWLPKIDPVDRED